MQDAAVLFLVLPFPTPVVNPDATIFPVTHGVPVHEFIGAQNLAGAKAGVSPEFGELVEAGINAGGDASALRIACPQQQDMR